jgi:hypothetical protein
MNGYEMMAESYRQLVKHGENDIIRAFVEMAVKNADIDEDSRNKVVGQLRWLFDEKMAKEVLEGR